MFSKTQTLAFPKFPEKFLKKITKPFFTIRNIIDLLSNLEKKNKNNI